ncbi:MAG TPA: hypothetical protein VGG16_22795 [Streptosporangiaceae bacterium]
MATSLERTLRSSARSSACSSAGLTESGARRLNCSISQVMSMAVASGRRPPSRCARAAISVMHSMLRLAVRRIRAVVSICPASEASAPERSSTQAATYPARPAHASSALSASSAAASACSIARTHRRWSSSVLLPYRR